MRIELTINVDGTDEEQFDLLQALEEAAEISEEFLLTGFGTNNVLPCDVVSVVEVPERAVRGPAKKMP